MPESPRRYFLMRIDYLKIGRYKNLTDFEITFDETQLTSVLIGENGTGKSNLFEAIVLIFSNIELEKKPEFAYQIKYKCRGRDIHIISDPNEKPQMKISVDGNKITIKKFRENIDDYLPKHIFAYYSGPGQRLEELFHPHQKRCYDALRKGDEQSLRRFFYCNLVYSQYVLMAYMTDQDESSKIFLKDFFGIESLDSVLFVMKRPWFAKIIKPAMKEQGDERFWYSVGVVSKFLGNLWEHSLAPIYNQEKIRTDFRDRTQDEDLLYLFVKDENKLRQLAGMYRTPGEFFAHLESTYINDLIREVRIKVRRRGVKGEMIFKELSEGEQQLLTVIGLMKFTKDEESLFLLDEPDTHLNPVWKVSYLDTVEGVVGTGSNSQLIMATHDPLVIGGLLKEQVRVLIKEKERIRTITPDEDPRGMGVAGLLKSELFRLSSTVDLKTLDKIHRRNELFAKEGKLSPAEDAEMRNLSDELAGLGFTMNHRDPYYDLFVREMAKRQKIRKPVLTPEERDEQEKIANEILDEILSEKNE